MADTNTIYVKAHPKIGQQVAIWEVNERHPLNPAGEPEIWVAGQEQEPQQVAQTSRVLDALRNDRLVQVTKSGNEPKNPVVPPNDDPPAPVVPPLPNGTPSSNAGNGEG